MKKLLLIAALAAVAFGANADGYKLEKVWEINDVSFLGANTDARQGFGMNGKFYINNKKLVVDTIDGVPTVTTAPVVYEVDQNGLTGVTFEGGLNCGITCDEAGNIIVSNAVFPNVWKEDATLRVINPETGEVKDHLIPPGCTIEGRCDMLGFAKGNLMEDGEIYIVGATQSGVARIVVIDGEVSEDESYIMVCEGVTPTSSTVLNYYVDKNGEEAVLYVTRNAPLRKLAFDGDNFSTSLITCPGKGATNGTFPFVWDGMELFIYPTLPNYLDGWAISESDAESPLMEVAPTLAANVNGFQCNWFNAEVDDNGVTIYQYCPNHYLAVWRLTKDEPAPEYEIGDVNHDTKVDVSDVTMLIAYVLGDNNENFFVTEANVNDGDDKIDVGDVTSLIAKILNN